MEKTIEFNTIKEFGENKDVNACDTNVKMHYDKSKKKYITIIDNGKKT